MGITDIDDKIIKKYASKTMDNCKEMQLKEMTQYYESKFIQDLLSLNVIEFSNV